MSHSQAGSRGGNARHIQDMATSKEAIQLSHVESAVRIPANCRLLPSFICCCLLFTINLRNIRAARFQYYVSKEKSAIE